MTRLIPDSYEMYMRYRSAMLTAMQGVLPANYPFSVADYDAWLAADAVLITEYDQAADAGEEQKQAADAALAAFPVGRMYTADYYSVMNRAIKRGEIPASHREFYDLEASDSNIPNMDSEANYILWSERVAKGEAKRIAAGGPPMAFPTAAAVAAKLAIARAAQKAHGEAQIKAGKEVADIAGPHAVASKKMMRLYDTLIFNNPEASQGQLNLLQRQYGMEFYLGPGQSDTFTLTVNATSTLVVPNVVLVEGNVLTITLKTDQGKGFVCKDPAGCEAAGKPLVFNLPMIFTVPDLPGPGNQLVFTNIGPDAYVVEVKVEG